MTQIRRDIDARRFPVEMVTIAQQSWASGETAAKSVTTGKLNGICEQIEVKLNDNTSGATATVAIASANSGQLYSQAGIAENATTVYKATSDASDFDAFLVDGALTVTITPSKDPSTSGMTVDVYLYLR